MNHELRLDVISCLYSITHLAKQIDLPDDDEFMKVTNYAYKSFTEEENITEKDILTAMGSIASFQYLINKINDGENEYLNLQFRFFESTYKSLESLVS